MVHETRSHAYAVEDEEKVGAKKAKAELKGQEGDQPSIKNKKAKVSNSEIGDANGKSADEVNAEFNEFCKIIRDHLSTDEMRKILEANGQDPSGSDDAVVPRCQDMLFFGPLERCPLCEGQLAYTARNYECTGIYSPWSACVYKIRDRPEKDQPLAVPDGIGDETVSDWVKKQRSRPYPVRPLAPEDQPFTGMMIALTSRLSRTHKTWREEIEKHGGKVARSAKGATCLVASPAEKDRGGSSRLVEAIERNTTVVSEEWLIDSIERKAALPLNRYDLSSELAPESKRALDKGDPTKDALKSLMGEIKLYGKRGVHKDSRLGHVGRIFERDGIIYNCAFSMCDVGRGVNELCIMQLITVGENSIHLYYKKGSVEDDTRAEERNEELSTVDSAVKEFVRLFEELTGNEFEPWEREKKFEKRPFKFFPVDMDEGIDVRYGGLAHHQLGIAVAHCKLDPFVANFMKILCSQEIYRYALMDMGHDTLDLPIGMFSGLHLRRCEEGLLEFRDWLKSRPELDEESNALFVDLSSKWFTMMPSTQPFTVRNFEELTDHVASPLESIRDVTVASHLIGDLTRAITDDPLFDCYEKLGCLMSPLDKSTDDYSMIVKYLEKTCESVQLEDVIYGVSVGNVFTVDASAGPSYDDIKKLPNKVLLWCGTRSSNLLRHLHKGFLPSICSIPFPGYMFGKAVVCSDAAAEAARCGFTAADRPEGFLVLAVASLGEQITEITNAPEDPESLREKKIGVKGLGRMTTDESEHFVWKDDIKVPCGRLVPSGHDNSPLEYNEYAVYDPKQVSIRFLVEVRYEEKNMEMDTVP